MNAVLRPRTVPATPLGRLAELAAAGADGTGVTASGGADLAGAAVTDALPGSVNGTTADSSDVQPGDLFVPLPGERVHGIRFAEQARPRGAVAVLTDPAGAAELARMTDPAA